jgi:hypothetical protein
MAYSGKSFEIPIGGIGSAPAAEIIARSYKGVAGIGYMATSAEVEVFLERQREDRIAKLAEIAINEAEKVAKTSVERVEYAEA